ncbi:hypothetical protein [Natronosalvus caseinilyticus]|uniref:hypothetical protein n=1 Tax=Natronosalvus caseinilyticus TaxID=2953747 RepID=UPI0028AEDF80|nr:hypothetical protein [Natronosalvus caseinilyticus]
MISQSVSDHVHRASSFLEAHPFLRWFVVPIGFMGGIVAALAILVGGSTPLEIAQVVGLYALFCFGVVVLGLIVERVFESLVG